MGRWVDVCITMDELRHKTNQLSTAMNSTVS